ncbi:MAG: putative phage repressor [Bradyrhizobium sp.]|nr:putative phage repressor [Bradyrhizobium sp.]
MNETESQSMVPAMATLAHRIKRLRKLHGLSQEKFAEALGEIAGKKVSRGAVGNWELGEGIRQVNLTAIAEKFDVALDWLERGIGPEPTKDRSAATMQWLTTPRKVQVPTPSNAQLAGAVSLMKKVPAYGQAMGGRHGEFVLNGNKVADILAPASLDGVPNAYAVYVAGSSMEPRYFAGEAAFVHPGLPVRRGDFVVAQILTGEDGDSAPLAYVKRFVSMDDKKLRLEQFNPKKTLEFPRKRVVSVHLILMAGRG